MKSTLSKKFIISLSIFLCLLVFVAVMFFFGSPGRDKIMPESRYYKIDLACEKVYKFLFVTRFQRANKEIDIIIERILEFDYSSDKDLDVDKVLGMVHSQIVCADNAIGKVKNSRQRVILYDKYLSIVLPFLDRVKAETGLKDSPIIGQISAQIMQSIEKLDPDSKANINEKFRESLDNIYSTSDVNTVPTNQDNPPSVDPVPNDGAKNNLQIDKIDQAVLNKIAEEACGVGSGVADKSKVITSKGYLAVWSLSTVDAHNDATLITLARNTSEGIKTIWVKDVEDLYGVDPSTLLSGTNLTSSEMNWLLTISEQEDNSVDKVFYQ